MNAAIKPTLKDTCGTLRCQDELRKSSAQDTNNIKHTLSQILELRDKKVDGGFPPGQMLSLAQKTCGYPASHNSIRLA
ncbi:hypothetical protein J6590_013021 [Homalodisca vitripennis]|nr:hypothetical protein J6590_013021 [Homalodisca vitripennis]